VSWTTGIARRPVLASLAGLLGIAAAGGLVYEGAYVFGRRYPHTKFDDLLDQLPDRESAAKLGRAVIAQIHSHTDVPIPAMAPRAIAADLRTGAGQGSIPRAMAAEIAQGRLVAIQGWVLPLSLVQVSVLAAEVQQAS
jgi:hypothetical protein